MKHALNYFLSFCSYFCGPGPQLTVWSSRNLYSLRYFLPCGGRRPVSLLLYWSFLTGWSSWNLYSVRFPSLAEADDPSVFILYWSFLTVLSSQNLYSVRFSSLAEAGDPSVFTVHKGNHMSPFINLEH